MSPVVAFEVIAVVLGALSAMITAAKKGLDFVGTFALAGVTAFGGGTIRDVILDRRPFFWVDRWEYLVVIFALCIPFVYSATVLLWSRRVIARAELVDALGLGFFSVVGVSLALQAKMPVVVAILMGVVTSTGGGVIRDLLINEIPAVFRHGSLYSTAAFMGAVSYTVLRDRYPGIAVFVSVSLAVGLRLFSVYRGATLPRPHWLHTDAHPIPTGEHRAKAVKGEG